MVADATLLVANVKITSAHMACPFVIHFRTYRKSHWFRWGLMFQGAISVRLGMMPEDERLNEVILMGPRRSP
jgi:hypothetical protein